MKCLSVLQPWAWAIIHGPKRVENRTWPTNFRGRLYIHAGKGRRWLVESEPATWQERYGVECPAVDSFAFGAIIGHVDVTDCVPVSRIGNNPWACGPWCWKLANPAALPSPIPYSGKLTLFEVPDSILYVAN